MGERPGQVRRPHRLQADQLNKALCKRLAGRYADGEAFEAWGWPRQQDMSYAQVANLLHETGFEVPRANPNGSVPACVFWVHRVREPTLVHGVFSLAAAAATRAGLPVHLLLDDVELTDDERQGRCEEIESRIRGWIAFASGNDARLTTSLYSEVLTDEYLMSRGWSAVLDYLSTPTTVLQFLRASKAISPQQYSTDAEASALELLRNENSIRTDRLLTALRNWLVFEAEIGRLLDMPSTGSGSVVTLGGGDERVLWEIWRRGCPRGLPARVQHIFLKPMPTPSSQTWDEPALTASDTSRSALESYLIKRTRSDGHTDLVDWLLKAAVRSAGAAQPGLPRRAFAAAGEYRDPHRRVQPGAGSGRSPAGQGHRGLVRRVTRLRHRSRRYPGVYSAAPSAVGSRASKRVVQNAARVLSRSGAPQGIMAMHTAEAVEEWLGALRV